MRRLFKVLRQKFARLRDKQRTSAVRRDVPAHEAIRGSGQAQQAFCQGHSLPRSTFQFWLRRYRLSKQGQAGGAQAFIPLKINQRPSSCANGFRHANSEAARAPQVVIRFGDGTQVEGSNPLSGDVRLFELPHHTTLPHNPSN